MWNTRAHDAAGPVRRPVAVQLPTAPQNQEVFVISGTSMSSEKPSNADWAGLFISPTLI
jgi:hypothetical protein